MTTNQAVKSTANYNVIMSPELEHYMTLDEMHQRLVQTIKDHFAKK